MGAPMPADLVNNGIIMTVKAGLSSSFKPKLTAIASPVAILIIIHHYIVKTTVSASVAFMLCSHGDLSLGVTDSFLD